MTGMISRAVMFSLALTLFASVTVTTRDVPETVHFPTANGSVKLVGYLFKPQGGGAHPAIVMLHGRAGPYSSAAHGRYDATTLSKRHKEWGEFWAQRGYLALLVDSFGPRGYAKGFPRASYADRPDAVSEQTVRPLDAYGALKYLRGRNDVKPYHIGVQGWSNGGMTALVTMGTETPGLDHPTAQTGFRAALAEYPGCGMDAVKGEWRPYAPVLMLLGSADEEVSPKRCETFAKKAQKSGGPLEYHVFDGAEHNYDDPGDKKQSNPANATATEETKRMAESFFAKALGAQ
jgi:dienelactone hydrolase